MEAPKTLQQAILWFAQYENCKAFLTELRWANGVHCPNCGSTKVVYLENARLWKCYNKHPKAKFSLKTGTIFEDSPLPLDKWLTALWMLVTCRNGVSSCEVARSLGITQKSAWFMMHRLRFALYSGSFDKLTGEVEVDETFIGGKARNMHKSKRDDRITGRGPKDKNIVFGMLERDGQVRVMHVEKRTKRELQSQIREHVAAGSAIFSDELLSYDGLEKDFEHQVINHAVEYVNGNVHTNGMENFWSLLKRGLHGTYVSVEPYHLFRYLDEQAYRFNTRKDSEFERFRAAAAQIINKRLTWDNLTGKLLEGETSPA